jgi:hypothetical protein
MTYYVLAWTGTGNYNATDAVRTYKSASAAQKYADKLNETGGCYVVRSSPYVKG